MVALVRLVEATGLRPVLDETFPLAETRPALERMEAGQHTGKIIVAVGPDGPLPRPLPRPGTRGTFGCAGEGCLGGPMVHVMVFAV